MALSGDGWEAYGLFTDGKNPELPFENRQKPTWLLPEKYPVTGTPNDDFFVYVKNIPFVNISNNEQDSITYMATENVYMNGNCQAAVPGFNNYLEKYPKTAFV